MNKDKFLTLRWSNTLSLGLGLVFLAYSIIAFATSASSGLGGFIGLVVIGILY